MGEILASSDRLEIASRYIESAIPYVRLLDGWGFYHRSDIGSIELVRRRTELAERVRRLYGHRLEKGTVGKRVDWLPRVGRIDPVEALKEGLRK